VWTLNAVQLKKLRMLSVATIAREKIDKRFHSNGHHNDGDGGEALSSSSNDVEMTAEDATTNISKHSKYPRRRRRRA